MWKESLWKSEWLLKRKKNIYDRIIDLSRDIEKTLHNFAKINPVFLSCW